MGRPGRRHSAEGGTDAEGGPGDEAATSVVQGRASDSPPMTPSKHPRPLPYPAGPLSLVLAGVCATRACRSIRTASEYAGSRSVRPALDPGRRLPTPCRPKESSAFGGLGGRQGLAAQIWRKCLAGSGAHQRKDNTQRPQRFWPMRPGALWRTASRQFQSSSRVRAQDLELPRAIKLLASPGLRRFRARR